MRLGFPPQSTAAVFLSILATACSTSRRTAPAAEATSKGIAPPSTTAATATAATQRSGPLVINVTARQFDWMFKYTTGKISNELHLPPGRRVEFRVSSLDVIHAMYIPAMRVKIDAVPARIGTLTVLTPDSPAEFPLHCAELCGVGHSTCGAKVIVQTRTEFETWLAAR